MYKRQEVFVTQALCVPRNDDNFIRIGDEYELLYFDRHQGWVSLLQMIAENTTIKCKVPDNALLLLKDKTRGKEELVFIFKNHRQMYVTNI